MPAPVLPAPTAAAPASIDFSGIPGLTMSRALLYLPGRDQIYARVLRQFSDSYSQGVPGLDAALHAGDWASAQRLLHSLRGACGAVGAISLQAEAQALDARLKGLESPGAVVIDPPDASALHACLSALVAAVRARLGGGDAPAAPPGGPVADTAALSAGLRALVNQLRQADFQSGAQFRRIEPALHAALGAHEVQHLSQPLRMHDYEAALVQAELLLSRLPSQPAPRGAGQ